jgi:hemoglobin
VIVVALLGACQPVQPAVPPDPALDRVGLSEDHRTDYTLFYEFDRPDNKSARVIYANEAAASVKPGEAFPYGSVLVMEVYRTKRDDAGNVLRDAGGRYEREELSGIFVMRKEPGFGKKYGAARNGDWEYVAYRADQSFPGMRDSRRIGFRTPREDSRLQCKQQRFEFFAAVAAALQMILHEWQCLGGTYTRQHQFGECPASCAHHSASVLPVMRRLR